MTDREFSDITAEVDALLEDPKLLRQSPPLAKHSRMQIVSTRWVSARCVTRSG